MKFTRRKFLRTAAAVTGSVLVMGEAVAGQRPFDAGRPDGTDPLSRMGWESFEPHQGSSFTFYQKRTPVQMRMAAITATGPAGTLDERRCFLITFVSDREARLRQGTYRVEHPALGTFELFITEGGKHKNTNSYHAVINRITE